MLRTARVGTLTDQECSFKQNVISDSQRKFIAGCIGCSLFLPINKLLIPEGLQLHKSASRLPGQESAENNPACVSVCVTNGSESFDD